MASKPLSAAEFATWLRPIDALAKFENANFQIAASGIVRGLVEGTIVAAAETLTFEGATAHRSRIPAGLWRDWPGDNDTRFWVTGDFFRLVGSPSGKVQSDHRIEAFGVRFEPGGIEPLVSERRELVGEHRAGRSGGRRAGTHGEPIARSVKRLLALPPVELASYKVEVLATELADEYRALGLKPPHHDNAKRDASGILRTLRDGYEN